MAYPVRAIVRPAVLEGTTNGKLPESILVTTRGQAGGVDVRLVSPAARAWRALCAAALAAGHTLKAVGPADSYRPYSVQERIFRQRYQLTPLSGRPTKTWEGRVWYQLPRTAVAAVPGTSNHGWGITVDTGEENDGDAGAESLDNPTLGWLLANEERFGWSHELQSEPWHIRYFAGDQIPQAVLDFEANDQEDDMFDPATDGARLANVNTLLDQNLAPAVGRMELMMWGLKHDIAAISPEVDEKALAKELGPMLAGAITSLDEDDLASIAKAVNDEQAKRLQD